MRRIAVIMGAAFIIATLALTMLACSCVKEESLTAEQMMPHFTPVPKDLFEDRWK